MAIEIYRAFLRWRLPWTHLACLSCGSSDSHGSHNLATGSRIRTTGFAHGLAPHARLVPRHTGAAAGAAAGAGAAGRTRRAGHDGAGGTVANAANDAGAHGAHGWRGNDGIGGAKPPDASNAYARARQGRVPMCVQPSRVIGDSHK